MVSTTRVGDSRQSGAETSLWGWHLEHATNWLPLDHLIHAPPPLGGTSEGLYYNDWYCDQGKRYNATPDEYMTDTISKHARAFMQQALMGDKPFFACKLRTGAWRLGTRTPDLALFIDGVTHVCMPPTPGPHQAQTP